MGSGSTSARSEFALRHSHRNIIWTYVKNMPGALFWLLLPAHALVNLAYLLAAALTGRGSTIARAKREALKGCPQSAGNAAKFRPANAFRPCALPAIGVESLCAPGQIALQVKN